MCGEVIIQTALQKESIRVKTCIDVYVKLNGIRLETLKFLIKKVWRRPTLKGHSSAAPATRPSEGENDVGAAVLKHRGQL